MKTPLVLLALSTILAASAPAALIVSDSFDDGGRTDGADPLDTSWYKNSSASTLAVVADSGAFASNVLQYNPGATFQALNAAVPSSTLVNTGDSIRVTVSFRYTSTPASVAGGIRVGLFNSPVALADTATRTDPGSGNTAAGYYANFVSGTFSSPTNVSGSSNELFRESGTVDGILGGTDRTAIGTPVGAASVINNTDIHTMSLLITKTALGLTLTSYLDNAQINTGNVTTSLITTYNMLSISEAGNNTNLLIDNVQVDFIPEPSSFMLGALGAIGLVTRRRR